MGIVAISASYPRPPLGYRPSHGGALGGIDPFTLLLLKDGGLGHGKGGLSSLLPLLLLGGGGLGGECKEKYHPCTQPSAANMDGDQLCGRDTGHSCDGEKCKMCCTCPATHP